MPVETRINGFDGKSVLVTGHAGFIGSNLVRRLFAEMKSGVIVGVDNQNDYYDTSLKSYRLEELDRAKPDGVKYLSLKGDIADNAGDIADPEHFGK